MLVENGTCGVCSSTRNMEAKIRIPDSVMNYDHEIPSLYEDGDVNGNEYLGEHDCSPHPFDILAIYALYQTVE